jgi:hypothetical protein
VNALDLLSRELDRVTTQRDRLRADVKRLRARATDHRYYVKHKVEIAARRRTQYPRMNATRRARVAAAKAAKSVAGS